MRFSLLYPNDKGARDQAIGLVTQVLKQGANLASQGVRLLHYQTIPGWPAYASLEHLPLNIQCERLEYVEEVLSPHGCMIIDVEVEIIKPEEPAAPIVPAEQPNEDKPKEQQDTNNMVQESPTSSEGVGQGNVDSQQCSPAQ